MTGRKQYNRLLSNSTQNAAGIPFRTQYTEKASSLNLDYS
jgi:hypothetical protein